MGRMAVPEAVAARLTALNTEPLYEDGLDDLSSIRHEISPQEHTRLMAAMDAWLKEMESVYGPASEQELARAEQDLYGDA